MFSKINLVLPFNSHPTIPERYLPKAMANSNFNDGIVTALLGTIIKY